MFLLCEPLVDRQARKKVKELTVFRPHDFRFRHAEFIPSVEYKPRRGKTYISPPASFFDSASISPCASTLNDSIASFISVVSSSGRRPLT